MATYYQQPAPQPSVSPRPIGDILRELPQRYWHTLTHPAPQTFAEEMGRASWREVWTQVITWGILSALVGFFVRLFNPFPGAFIWQQITGREVADAYTKQPGAALGDVIGVPLGFFIVMGVLYLLARLLGGQGTFVAQAYTSLLFSVPLGLLSTFFGAFAFTGLLTFAIAIYEIVLQIFAVMAVHRFSGGRATLAVLLPGILMLAIALAVAALVVGFILLLFGAGR